MSFWTRKKKGSGKPTPKGDRGRVQKAKKTIMRSRPVAMEVKILSQVFVVWCQEHQVEIRYIQPGKPNQNA